MVRLVEEKDFNELRRIHYKFYSGEFTLDEFFNKFITAFVVTNDNDNDKIICAAAVRTIVEAVALTDKDCPVNDRRTALYHILDACMFTSSKTGYDQLHAFVQDDHWSRHLKKAGFQKCKGEALFIDI